MKTVLLSFNPKYYEPLKNGEKKYEYRSRFANDDIKAYLYLSSPIRKVVAIVYFGKRISLEKMLEMYADNSNAVCRINDYINQYKKKYAVPVLKIDFLEPISLEEIRKHIPGFMPPQSYMIIKENSELEEILKKMNYNGSSIVLDHENVTADEVCIN